jgi:hypothetical protein
MDSEIATRFLNLVSYEHLNTIPSWKDAAFRKFVPGLYVLITVRVVALQRAQRDQENT